MTPKALIFLGDSLTHRHDWSSFDASNMGIDGDTTDGVYARVQMCKDAKRIVLMIGVNDILQGAPLELIQEYYRAILEAFDEKQQIYVISVLPVIDEPQTKQVNRDIRRLNAWLKDEAPRHRAVFLNFHPRFLEGEGLASRYTTDGVHLTQEAYALLEALLSEALN